MCNTLQFRTATEDDCTELALIRDIAGRRMPSYLWSQEVGQGESFFEFGREKIRTDANYDAYFDNWRVAESKSKFVGAFFGFSVDDPYPDIDLDAVPACFRPCVELEKVARGCWLLQAIAILPEYRGKGLARQLLGKAESVAKDAGANRIALQVEEVNEVAFRTYQSNGYVEVDRRPYVHFPGSEDTGDVVLMWKEVS
jgi:ribosomal protein S18 acetylase RimI-like enzyme